MADKGLNATAAALLGLLHEGAMTGGQLMAAAESRLGPFWTTTRSQVYRELPALAERGYVRTGKPGPRSSQPYAITAAGKRAFSRWLSEPASRAVRGPGRRAHQPARRAARGAEGGKEGRRPVPGRHAGVRHHLPARADQVARLGPGALSKDATVRLVTPH